MHTNPLLYVEEIGMKKNIEQGEEILNIQDKCDASSWKKLNKKNP